MKGILADIHMKGPVDALVREMQSEPWAELWKDLGLHLFYLEDVGLAPTSTDLEIWQCCQSQQLIFITNNRNQDSPDSLEAAIRLHNSPACLPVFTVGDLDRFRKSRAYAMRVLERLYEYLVDIDNVRGTGRQFLP